jgi:ABC-type transporter Mla subunit MlaD
MARLVFQVVFLSLLFGAFPLVMAVGLWAASLRQRRLFGRLHAGAATAAEAERQIRWVGWVKRCFLDRAKEPVRWTRDQADHELDRALFSQGRYLVIVRASYVAPLIGVFITMYQFVGGGVPSPAQLHVSDVFQAVAPPLFVGMGTGALLAVGCQFLSTLSHIQLSRTRRDGMRWFDDVVWPAMPLHQGDGLSAAVQSAELALARMRQVTTDFAEQTTQALGKLVVTVQASTESHQAATRAITAAAEGLAGASGGLHDQAVQLHQQMGGVLAGIGSRVGELGESLRSLKDQAAVFQELRQPVNALTLSAGQFGTSATKFEESRLAFQATLEQAAAGLAAASHRHDDVSEKLQALLRSFDGAGGKIDRSAQELQTSAERFGKAAGSLEGVSQRIESASGGLQDLRTSVTEPLRDTVSQINSVLKDLGATTGDLRKLLELQPQLRPLLEALARATQVAGEMEKLPGSVRKALDGTRAELEKLSKQALADQATELEAVLRTVLAQMGLVDRKA